VLESSQFSQQTAVFQQRAAVHIVAETASNQLFCVATLRAKCQGFAALSRKTAVLVGFPRFLGEAWSRSIKK
jgi:hypothetical protein